MSSWPPTASAISSGSFQFSIRAWPIPGCQSRTTASSICTGPAIFRRARNDVDLANVVQQAGQQRLVGPDLARLPGHGVRQSRDAHTLLPEFLEIGANMRQIARMAQLRGRIRQRRGANAVVTDARDGNLQIRYTRDPPRCNSVELAIVSMRAARPASELTTRAMRSLVTLVVAEGMLHARGGVRKRRQIDPARGQFLGQSAQKLER